MRRALGRHGGQVAVVAVGLASVLAAGTASAVHLDDRQSPAATTAVLGQDLQPAPSRADRDRVVETPAAPDAQQTVQAAPVAPLGELASPDVLVRSTTPLPADLVAELQGIEGVTASVLLDAGSVPVAGRPASLLGADPSQLRAFTPQETAASDDLWQAVARGDVAASYAMQQQRGLQLGQDVDAAGRAVRLGAVAAFGLPGSDVVATRDLARSLGAVPDSVLVLSAPDVRTSRLQKAVERVAGSGVVVDLLRPADVAPSQVKGRPGSWRELYVDSARFCPGLSWQILAAIGQVESGHGKNLGPSSAGALGPMQFMPATWAAYGIDGDGDGSADIMSPFDAVPSAARYLCQHGATNGEDGLYNAIFAYNHADWYVKKILATAQAYS